MPEINGPDKSQWRAWLKEDVTQIFFSDMENMRKEIVDAWCAGEYTRESAEGTAALQAKALGQVQMLDAILEIRTERILEDE